MKRWMLVLMVLLCLLTTPAMADVAPNVTGKCSFTMEQISTKQREALTDHSNWTYAELRRGRKIEIDGKKRKLGGLHLKILDTSNQLEVHAFVNGKWTRVRKSVEHLSQWVPLPEGTLKVRLINKGKENARIASIAVYGEGSRPATVPEWRSINKADILLLVAHPDDELLWFGGLLPTYAAERKLQVQVAYAASRPERRLELLEGLWTCGVKNYPVFMGFSDVPAMSRDVIYESWGKVRLESRVVELIRRFKPQVMVTHALNGEYGHGAHRAVADTTAKMIRHTSDPNYYKESAVNWGTWTVKKLYLHQYKNHRIRLDWSKPLKAFKDETSLSVATRALKCHRSQLKRWSMERANTPKTDNRIFGLYFTTVGYDVVGNDIMEHVTTSSASKNASDFVVQGDDETD